MDGKSRSRVAERWLSNPVRFRRFTSATHFILLLVLITLCTFSEAIGFMCGIHVPDKDGVSGAAHLAELAVHLEKEGLKLAEQLQKIYEK